ncbi:ACYPI004958 protein, partial [Aphis craccivora]
IYFKLRVLVQPLSTNCVVIDGIPTIISSQGSYYASASTGSTPLIPNEYPKQYYNYTYLLIVKLQMHFEFNIFLQIADTQIYLVPNAFKIIVW